MTSTPWFRFGGSNIKGTPAMSAPKVAHDLRVLQKNLDVVVVQEFKWRWYWATLHAVLAAVWGVSPRWRRGLARPIVGAQPVFWRRAMFKRLREMASMLHDGRAGISDTRWVRAVLLQPRKTALAFWALTTHFVVGGDAAGDGPERQEMMYDEDIPALDRMLTRVLDTGWPAILELDANVHVGSAAYPKLMAVFEKHGGQVIGARGVEYLVVFQGKRARIDVRKPDTIPTSKLYTDHEVRTVEARLTAR